MKILAIPATNSRNGINRQLLQHATTLLEAGLVPNADVELLDINDYEMPLFSTERHEALGIPEPAQRLYDKIGAADAVIISFAEHNGTYTAAWKNLYDWTSRIDMQVFQGRKVAMFAATPGPRAGAGVLGLATATAPFFGAELLGHVGVGSFADTFDADAGEIIDAEVRANVEKTLGALSG